MSDILLLVTNGEDAIVTTALIERLSKDGHHIHCMTDSSLIGLMRFCECYVDLLQTAHARYDIAINLSISKDATDVMSKVNATLKLGYGRKDDSVEFFNAGADLYYRSRVIGIPADANLFQLIFGIANVTWHGESYGVKYFPRNKSRKSLGIAIRHPVLRKFIKDNLGNPWYIPFKQNILKRFDEINRCKNIITDDETAMHVALALRKHVEYVLRKRVPYKVEMFGHGNMHIIENMNVNK